MLLYFLLFLVLPFPRYFPVLPILPRDRQGIFKSLHLSRLSPFSTPNAKETLTIRYPIKALCYYTHRYHSTTERLCILLSFRLARLHTRARMIPPFRQSSMKSEITLCYRQVKVQETAKQKLEK